MTKNTVLLITRDQEEYEEKLKKIDLPGLEIVVPKSPEEIREHIVRANILLAAPPLAKEYLDEAKSLRWLQSTFAGVDALNDPGLRKDYMLTNVRGVYGEVLAEYVFAYILYFKKEIAENIQHQQESEWSQRPTHTLEGKTISILGAGSIGREIARIAKAFRMRTLGYRTSRKPVEFFDEMFTSGELETCLSQGDYVVDVLPNTPATNDFVNHKTIAHMKSGVIFINIGRGNSVNEEDVARAVQEGKIARAVLDVFDAEPLPESSPLWLVKNVYLTPHMAGNIVTDEALKIFEENYRRFCAGEELQYKVDLDKGY